jgi:hypothetical protein
MLGIILIILGIMMINYARKMRLMGGTNVPHIFHGRPGLLTIVRVAGPVMVIVGILLLAYGI